VLSARPSRLFVQDENTGAAPMGALQYDFFGGGNEDVGLEDLGGLEGGLEVPRRHYQSGLYNYIDRREERGEEGVATVLLQSNFEF